MRIFVDTASLAEIEEWNDHDWVSGFTTNPTLYRAWGGADKWNGLGWAKELVRITTKPISIDGPPEVWDLGPNVIRKVASNRMPQSVLELGMGWDVAHRPVNHTAVVLPGQVRLLGWYTRQDIISVFAGRIMDTGRSPESVIRRAQDTGAQVLWASVREPYNILQAEEFGCDIVTVPPAILRKFIDWRGKPLEVVASETIAQFERDSEGLWT